MIIPSALVNLAIGLMNVVAVRVVSQDLSVTNLYVAGVSMQPSLTLPTLTTRLSGNTLTLTWPADHLGYRLMMQTSNLENGVSSHPNDWAEVPGSTTVTTMSMTISGTNEFYRLVYP